jgi:site-specific recombinase XerD
MISEDILGRSRLFRRLKTGAHGHIVELYAARLAREGLARHGTWRCLNIVGDFLDWVERSQLKLAHLDERVAERYLEHRGEKQCLQPGDRAALKRFLAVLRESDMIAPAPQPPITPEDRIFAGFSNYLRQERGLTPRSIITHQPVIRRFLREVCPAGASDLGNISREDVTLYIERHAGDRR